MTTCASAPTATRCNCPLRAVRDAGLTCPHTVEAALPAVNTTADHVSPPRGHRKFIRLVRANLAKRQVGHTFGDLSHGLLRRHRKNRRPKRLAPRWPSLGLCNGGGTTPGQVSPLMNAAATTPQVLCECLTRLALAADPHEEQAMSCLVVVVVVLLVVEMPGGEYRRRTFLTLAAAEGRCRNARNAGHRASATITPLVLMAVMS